MNSKNIPNATFSQELPGGHTHCNSHNGPQIEMFGQEVALASLSVPQESKKESKMSAICGQHGLISLRSAALQQSLGNRLQARLPMAGLMMSQMTWKVMDIRGGAIIPACSVGAPHKRDRLWFVGNSKHNGQYGHEVIRSNEETGDGRGKERADVSKQFKGASTPFDVSGLSGCSKGERQNTRGVGHIAGVLPQRCVDGQGQGEPWGNSQFIQCPDGKQRLVKPGICLLADGVSARVVKLSALGNAIVPQVAAEFIKSFMDIENDFEKVR